MKIAVMVLIEVLSNEIPVDNSPHFIEWDYPVLPRIGEHFIPVHKFLSNEMLESFKNIKAKDAYSDKDENDLQEFYGEETLYDLYSDPNGDRFIIFDIEWMFDDENGFYPIITIMDDYTYQEAYSK